MCSITLLVFIALEANASATLLAAKQLTDRVLKALRIPPADLDNTMCAARKRGGPRTKRLLQLASLKMQDLKRKEGVGHRLGLRDFGRPKVRGKPRYGMELLEEPDMEPEAVHTLKDGTRLALYEDGSSYRNNTGEFWPIYHVAGDTTRVYTWKDRSFTHIMLNGTLKEVGQHRPLKKLKTAEVFGYNHPMIHPEHHPEVDYLETYLLRRHGFHLPESWFEPENESESEIENLTQVNEEDPDEMDLDDEEKEEWQSILDAAKGNPMAADGGLRVVDPYEMYM
eukprot:gnl/TRDRNA2_/TRDRNA2_165462_c0_seq2.p1 gnl/TRDRNA2_/TRDRNA2_165462_c0~~gnl/TRDRNA2_/TRDRNA2_165462_c0_seq2.p1  ORF type:complete len:282 (-),score=47.25 gnl/TRDRNA2_/TRDRNA2_165462_c0_seq2:114-959(-)